MQGDARPLSGRRRWLSPCWWMIFLVPGLILGMTSPTLACLGARPLAMGGAFIAVADDVHATYWNPAALAFMKDTEATGMVVSGDINYQNYLAVAGRGWGLSRMSRIEGWLYDSTGATTGYVYIDYDESSKLWWSFGLKLSERLAAGVNVGQTTVNRDIYYTPDRQWLYYYNSTSGSGLGADFSLLYRVNNRLNLGLLVQDAIPTNVEFPRPGYVGNRPVEWVTNFRPGMSYRFSPQTIVALDIYGVGVEGYTPKPCFGVEHWATPNFAVRAGYYQDTVTFGAGLKLGREVSLDYAYLYESHIFSGTLRF